MFLGQYMPVAGGVPKIRLPKTGTENEPWKSHSLVNVYVDSADILRSAKEILFHHNMQSTRRRDSPAPNCWPTQPSPQQRMHCIGIHRNPYNS